jgi:hypothetical protein
MSVRADRERLPVGDLADSLDFVSTSEVLVAESANGADLTVPRLDEVTPPV